MFNSLADVGTENHKGEEDAKAEVLLLCISLFWPSPYLCLQFQISQDLCAVLKVFEAQLVIEAYLNKYSFTKQRTPKYTDFWSSQ